MYYFICKQFGIPVHEFVHALGVWHEMQRWDRDEVINVLWDNIANYRSQFFTQSTSDLGTEYDTSSVMHYAGKVSSFGKMPTLKNSLNTFNKVVHPKNVYSVATKSTTIFTF